MELSTEKQKATQLPCGLFALKGVNSRGLATLQLWKPKARNPHYAYCYTTEARRDEALADAVRNMEAWNKSKEERKAERKGKKSRTSVIKTALRKKYPEYEFSVVRGHGTASGWIEIAVEVPRPTACSCGGSYPRCSPCAEKTRNLDEEIRREVDSSLEAEGMELSYYSPDDGYGDDRSELLIQIGYPRASTPVSI